MAKHRPSRYPALHSPSIGFEDYTHHFLVVFGFGLLSDLDTVGRIDASVAATASFTFVLAWAHLRMPPANVGNLWGKLDRRLLGHAIYF